MDWRPWGYGDWTPNKYGYYGLNCKMKVRGSGTTHSNRRELRKHLQWENMATEDPASEACLEKHVENLKKAQEKAEKKLKDARQKALEKASDEESYESYYSTSSSSSIMPKKVPKKDVSHPPLEKGEEFVRTRRAKHGQNERLTAVKEELLEKSSQEKPTSSTEAAAKEVVQPAKSLEKDTQVLDKDDQAKSLEKDKAKEKEEWVEVVDESKKRRRHKTTKNKSLEKDTPGIVLKPAPPKKVVVVDWHNTLEVRNAVPGAHQEALRQLLEVADVHIVSYVETQYRHLQVMQDVWDMVDTDNLEKLSGVHCCWERVGYDGKRAWCEYLGAHAIIDDSNEVLVDCKNGGLQIFGITTHHCQHGNLSVKDVYSSFTQAVESYLYLHQLEN